MSQQLPPLKSGAIVVAVLAAMMGLFGVCGGTLNLVGVVLNGSLSDMTEAGMTGAQAAAYRDMMEASAVLTPISGLLSFAGVLVSGGLVAGVVLLLQRRARGLLKSALVAMFLLILLQAVLGVANYALIQAPMQEYLSASMNGVQVGGMEAIIKGSVVISLLLGMGWMAVKAAFCVGSVWILGGEPSTDEG
ncbi:MAG: hypothetical protein JXX28_18140 [Deltaproteobacteria bacterium]|nr:hypothetical protein [Deltaproteobacteria bacterium]